jgi:shikimate dehydrogenase
MSDRYAVIGNPVAHSRSPQIHAAFAAQTGEDVTYSRLLAPVGGFRDAVEAFRTEGGRGLNVTLPFKLEAFAMANEASDRSKDARAANFLSFEDSLIRADNTDGAGLVADLTRNLSIGLEAKRVLLLGAGGAAQGVLGPLLACGPAMLAIANRTVDKARLLAQAFPHHPGAARTVVSGLAYSELPAHPFDVVINATSTSLQGTVPPLPAGVFAPGSLAYDMMYGAQPTPFMVFAAAHGAQRTADGLGMLVEQAAESFYLWRGVRPHTAPVIQLLRAQ